MCFKSGFIVVKLDESEYVGLLLTLTDLESAAAGFLGASIFGFFFDPGDELIHAIGIDFDVDE